MAERLQGRGHQTLWAIPSSRWLSVQRTDLIGPHLVGPDMRIVRPDFAPYVNSWADIMLTLGWGHAGHVTHAVCGWMKLLTRSKADAVVVDLAPSAQMAALLLGLPCYQITNGFDRPTPDCPIFHITGSSLQHKQLNEARRHQLQRTLNVVGKLCTGRLDVDLPWFIQSPTALLATIPEADPYGPRSDGFTLGPLMPQAAEDLHNSGMSQVDPWLQRSGTRVLAYLRTHPGALAVINALMLRQTNTLCIWPDAPPSVVQGLVGTSIRVSTQRLDLNSILASADVVINYGSGAMVCHTLLAGKPQLMIPIDAEKFIIARAVARLGAGICCREISGVDLYISEIFNNYLKYSSSILKIYDFYKGEFFGDESNRFMKSMKQGFSID